jgi:DNA-binding CsgD family transcriptional regulator
VSTFCVIWTRRQGWGVIVTKSQSIITKTTTNVAQDAPLAASPNGILLDRQSVGYAPSGWQQAQTDAETPPWQRDTGFCDSIKKSARSERHALIMTLVAQARAGVILDDKSQVLEGTNGWVSHVAKLATLRLHNGSLTPASTVSESDFAQAISRLINDQTSGPVSVLLRDLDGWGTDLLQMTRVGSANPNCVLVLLPKSVSDVGAVVDHLGQTLGLTKKEIAIAKLVLEGRIDLEIAASLGIEAVAAKRAIGSILGKFRVRRRSDLVRLFSRLP